MKLYIVLKSRIDMQGRSVAFESWRTRRQAQAAIGARLREWPDRDHIYTVVLMYQHNMP